MRLAVAIPLTIYVLWLWDFIYTYLQLLNQHYYTRIYEISVKNLPFECRDHARYNVLAKVFIFMRKRFGKVDRCKDLFLIKNSEVMWSVTPMNVVVRQVESSVITLIESVGIAYSNIISKMIHGSTLTTVLPQLLAVPIIFSLLYATLCFIGTICLNRDFTMCLWKFNFKSHHKKLPDTITVVATTDINSYGNGNGDRNGDDGNKNDSNANETYTITDRFHSAPTLHPSITDNCWRRNDSAEGGSSNGNSCDSNANRKIDSKVDENDKVENKNERDDDGKGNGNDDNDGDCAAAAAKDNDHGGNINVSR